MSHDVYWTYLANTVDIGQTAITFTESVDWAIGDVILITTTTFESKQTERLTIVGVSNGGKIITTTTPTQFRHSTSDLPDFSDLPSELGPFERMSAKVALITRNI